jgi:hypothetical protein
LISPFSHSVPSLPNLAKRVNKEVLPFSGGLWLAPSGVGRWQGPNGQPMREQWCGSAANRARKGRCQAEARLQTALEKSSSQSVSTFS